MCIITNKQHCTACDWITDLPRGVDPCETLIALANEKPNIYRAGSTGHGLRDTCLDVSYAINSVARDDHCHHEEMRERYRLEKLERERLKGAEKLARKDAKVGSTFSSSGSGGAVGLFKARKDSVAPSGWKAKMGFKEPRYDDTLEEV